MFNNKLKMDSVAEVVKQIMDEAEEAKKLEEKVDRAKRTTDTLKGRVSGGKDNEHFSYKVGYTHEEKKAMQKEDEVEESGLRKKAHASAAAGKKSFEFQGKTLPVTVKKEEVEDDKAKKAVVKVKTNKPIGTRVADIGPGGKEYNVKTNKAYDDHMKVKEEVVIEKNESHTHAAHYENEKGEWTGMNLLVAKDDDDAVKQAHEKCKEGCRLSRVERHTPVKESYNRQQMPLKGHEYHSKSDAALKHIMKDAGEAAKAMKDHSPSSESKYLDQVNDAATVLHYRKKHNLMGHVKDKDVRKEDVEQMDEKKGTGKYDKKKTQSPDEQHKVVAGVRDAMRKAYDNVQKGRDERAAARFVAKLKYGTNDSKKTNEGFPTVADAKKRMDDREEVEGLDEADIYSIKNTKTGQIYHHSKYPITHKTNIYQQIKSKHGHEDATIHMNGKPVKEDVEQIDELKKSTVTSYIQKKFGKMSDEPVSKNQYGYAKKDAKGIRDAGLRMSGIKATQKEDVELDEAVSRKHFQQVADVIKSHPDQEKRNELAKHHADIFKKQNPRFDHGRFYSAAGANIKEDVELDERSLTPTEKKEKEHMVMSMKPKLKDFKKRYGEKDGKSVMYATATKKAKGE